MVASPDADMPSGAGRDQFLVRNHLRRESPESQPDNAVAYGYIRYFRANVEHMTAQLASQVSLFDESKRAEHVPEVQPCGFDRHQDFPRLKRACGQYLDFRLVEHAVPVRRKHPVRIVRQRQPLGRSSGAHKPRRHPAAQSVRDMVLIVRIHQVVHEFRRRRRM